jgi:hypothetical protein
MVTLTREEENDANTRQRANIFLQSIGIPRGGQATELPREDYRRRPGKEPAASGSQDGKKVTPPENKAQLHTPPTVSYGGAGTSRCKPKTARVASGTPEAANQNQRQRDPMANTPWGLWTAA